MIIDRCADCQHKAVSFTAAPCNKCKMTRKADRLTHFVKIIMEK